MERNEKKIKRPFLRKRWALISGLALAFSAACAVPVTCYTPMPSTIEPSATPTQTPTPTPTLFFVCYTPTPSLQPIDTLTPTCYTATPIATPTPVLIPPPEATFTPIPATPTPMPQTLDELREKLLVEGRFPEGVVKELK